MIATLTNSDVTLQRAERVAARLAKCLIDPACGVVIRRSEVQQRDCLWMNELLSGEIVGFGMLEQGWLSAAREKLETLAKCSAAEPGSWSLSEKPEEPESWHHFCLGFVASEGQVHAPYNQRGLLIDPDSLSDQCDLNYQLELWSSLAWNLSCHLILRADEISGYAVQEVCIGPFPDGGSIRTNVKEIIYGNIVIGGVMQIDFDSSFPLALEIGKIELPLRDALQLRAGSELAIECEFPLQGKLKVAEQKWADVELSVEAGVLKIKVI